MQNEVYVTTNKLTLKTALVRNSLYSKQAKTLPSGHVYSGQVSH